MKLKEVKKDNAFKNLLKACLDLADMNEMHYVTVTTFLPNLLTLNDITHR